MLSYCFKRKKETEIINPKVFKVSIYGGILLLSKYVVCNSKMSRFINEQDDIIMHEIVNRYLLAGEKFMSKMHLRQSVAPAFCFGKLVNLDLHTGLANHLLETKTE